MLAVSVLLDPVSLALTIAQVDGNLDALADYWPAFVDLGWFFATVLLVVLPGWFVFVPAVRRVVGQRNRNNRTLEEAISRYLRLLVLLVGVFAGAVAAGFTGFLTDSALVVAAATLALGVAAQSVIGSLVSGMVLVVDPEFNVGDYVEWAEGEGTIRSITLRVTRVQTPDGEVVTIPNDVLTSQAITRPFGHGRFRVVERVNLSYDEDLDAALDQLEAAAVDLEESLDAPNPRTYVDDLGSDAVVATVHFWVEDPDRHDVLAVRSAFARAATERLDAAGLTVSPASKRELEGRVEVGEAA
jgi:small conductance mechanosensitive channel